MVAAERPGLLDRIDRVWLLAPFKKEFGKREREKQFLSQLGECVDRLFRDPRHPSLNLETLNSTGRFQVLSARINQSCRLILIPLTKTEVGLLYFDNHDGAYRWVDRNRSRLQTMLMKDEELVRGVPLTAHFTSVPFVQLDEESPLAITAAGQFKAMVDEGVTRYLSYLDDEQRPLADLNVKGLLLVKGGAGTGKTAVALHRVLALARKPALPGITADRVLYLCYNTLLARVARQLLETLCGGVLPETVSVNTFHTWCAGFLQHAGVALPAVDEDRCQQAVYRFFVKLSTEQRAALGDLNGGFVDEEIVQVIKHNGLNNREPYLEFSRDRRAKLKRAGREVVWAVYEQAQEYQREQGICRYSDLPLLALQALEDLPDPSQYRAVVIDEGQDCSPVMVRLARRLLVESNGPLTVFADPAQEIYECGFQWTQKELRPSGGNVRWLRKTYRTTREIFDLARPLLDDHEDLQEDLAKMEAPIRRGPRPRLVVAKDAAELQHELVERITREVAIKPANQIGVLAADWETLRQLGAVLHKHGVPVSAAERGAVKLTEPTVKLLTMKGVKGLDFPSVFVVGPRRRDLGGPTHADLPGTRRTLYVALTRASEQLTIGMINGGHHPLLELLDDRTYDAEGSRAQGFVNLRGVTFGTDGQVSRQ